MSAIIEVGIPELNDEFSSRDDDARDDVNRSRDIPLASPSLKEADKRRLDACLLTLVALLALVAVDAPLATDFPIPFFLLVLAVDALELVDMDAFSFESIPTLLLPRFTSAELWVMLPIFCLGGIM